MTGSSSKKNLDAPYVYFASTSIIFQKFLIATQIFDLIFYREIHSTDPSHHVTDFSNTTSTSNLWKHLFTDHIANWITSCDQLNISITAAAAVEKLSASFVKNQLLHH